MRVALDTNRYRDLTAGDPHVVEIVERAETVAVPFVVVAELRAGFSLGKRAAENERVLRRLLSKDGVEILFAGEQTIYHYASVYSELRRRGTPIPTNDLWIAALVLEHDLALCSCDQHFDFLPQLPRV